MKKILIVHNKYQNIGGEDIAVENEIEILQKYYKVEVLYFTPSRYRAPRRASASGHAR